jgi:hypothetical protein
LYGNFLVDLEKYLENDMKEDKQLNLQIAKNVYKVFGGIGFIFAWLYFISYADVFPAGYLLPQLAVILAFSGGIFYVGKLKEKKLLKVQEEYQSEENREEKVDDLKDKLKDF